MQEINIKIGFKFSKKHKSITNKIYWKNYEVIGSCYGLHGGSYPDWKSKEDVLKTKQYIQIMDLPYPNENGLDGLYDNMINSQLTVEWISLKILKQEIEDDFKLLPEFRKFKIMQTHIQGTNEADDVNLTYEEALEQGLLEALKLI